MIELSNIQVGLLASVVTEALKFVPFANRNELTRSLTAIVVCFVGTLFLTTGGWDRLAEVLVYSLASYKLVVQPLGKVTSLSTQ